MALCRRTLEPLPSNREKDSGVTYVEAMRSILMVAPSQKYVDEDAVHQTKADALIFDLTDTGLRGDIAQTRAFAIGIIAKARRSGTRLKIYIRIHTLDTVECKDDLECVMPLAPDGIFLPHCREGADVQHLAGLLAVLEAKNDLLDGSTKIIASAVSEASAIFDLKSFQGANRRLVALCWDAAELAKSLGLHNITDASGTLLPPLAMARMLMLFAAKAANISALDTPAYHTGGETAFRRECETARRDGFDGKLALEPSQAAIINHVFAD